jgi:hypothetical protein
MTFMFCPHLCARCASHWDLLSKQICRALTLWSNGPGRNRHPEQNFSKNWLRSQFLDSFRPRNKPLPPQKLKSRRQSHLQPTTGFDVTSCRGDWIRTSDLLNPIFRVKAAPSRRMSQMQAFWRLTDSTLHTLYADHSRKSTIRPCFPGFSVPKRAHV